jgi:hypothetical protein
VRRAPNCAEAKIVGQTNFRPQRQFAHKTDPTMGDLRQ